MLVKCKCCGVKNERSESYKVITNGKNEYYCNEEEYKSMIKNKEYKNKSYDLITSIFGYKCINTLLFKELSRIIEISSYEKLYKYIDCNLDYLKQVMNKHFNNETGRIRYFSAIIKNNIVDYLDIENNVTTVTYDIEDIECIKYKAKTRRKCVMDYLNEEE